MCPRGCCFRRNVRPAQSERRHRDVDAVQEPVFGGAAVLVVVRAMATRWCLAAMHTWCVENVEASERTQAGVIDRSRRDELDIPMCFARLYFAHEADAEATPLKRQHY